MNNILLDSTKSFSKDGVYKIELSEDATFDLDRPFTKLYLVSVNDISLTINVRAKVEIYNFTTKNINITLNLEEGAVVNLYNMAIVKDKVVNNITAIHKSPKTESNLVCRGISYSRGDLSFVVNGIIPKGSSFSSCNQESRIINILEATSTIKPNFYIGEFSSLANHSAYTGPIDDKLLFYLKSKGISEDDCYELLLRAFFKSFDLPKDYEEVIDVNLKKVF